MMHPALLRLACLSSLALVPALALGAPPGSDPGLAPPRCDPYVQGLVTLDGVPLPDVAVHIENTGDGVFCNGGTFDDVTGPDGRFSTCVQCQGTVTITINGEPRTMWVDHLTDFGEWQISSAQDLDHDGISDLREDELLQRFAPQVRLHSSEWNFPAGVGWILPRSHMRFTHEGCGDDEILPHGTPTVANVTEQEHQSKDGFWDGCDHTGPYHHSDSYAPSNHKEGFFLQQYDSSHSGAGSQSDWVVYGHVYPRTQNHVVVQYWFFYSYNDGYGPANHESDWEYVLLVVDENDTVWDILYSQHNGAQLYGPQEVEWVGDHPVVYAAKGSHANYAQTSNGDCVGGPFFDNCNAGTYWNTWMTPQFGGIVNVGEKNDDFGSNWLRYSGRWGEIGETATTSGKFGPAYQWGSWHALGSTEICGNGVDDDVDGTVDEAACAASPDLVFEGLEPALFQNGCPGRMVGLAGDEVHVLSRVENQGGSTSSTVEVEVALSADDVYDPADTALSYNLYIHGMGQGDVSGPLPTWSAPIPFGTPAGTYHLTGMVDPDDDLWEGVDGEANNANVADYLVEVHESPLLLDNFNDCAAEAFTPYAGEWEVTCGAYVATGTGYDDNYTVSLVPSAEPSVCMDFDFWVVQAGGSYNPYLGAVLRFESDTQFLRVDTYRSGGATYVRLLGWDVGPIVIATAVLPGDLLTGVHRMRVEDTGCSVTVWIDDAVVLATPYDVATPQGQRGLFVNTASTVAFDNVVLETLPTDLDGDGFTVCDGDCDDTRAGVYPGRGENCNTSYDDNCNGQINEGCGGGGGKTPVEQAP